MTKEELIIFMKQVEQFMEDCLKSHQTIEGYHKALELLVKLKESLGAMVFKESPIVVQKKES